MSRTFCTFSLTRRCIAAVAGFAIAALLANRPGGSGVAEAAAPAGTDGSCTIDISIQTTPAFSERLSCRYSNFPDFQSDDLTWETPRGAAGRTINLATGKSTVDYARVRLNDDILPLATSEGSKDMFPVAGHVYALDSSGQINWSAMVEVFPDPRELAPVECKGGASRAAVAGTSFKSTWTSLNPNSKVVHGSAEAWLSCTKINLKGPNVPLGLIGNIVVKF